MRRRQEPETSNRTGFEMLAIGVLIFLVAHMADRIVLGLIATGVIGHG